MKKRVVLLIGGMLLLVLSGCGNRQSVRTGEKSVDFTLVKSEVVGSDEQGVTIVKGYHEGQDHFLEVTTIESMSLVGEIIVLGDATYNELVLVTAEDEHYVFRPEFREMFWAKQGQRLTLIGRVEKRVLTDKKTGKVLKKNWFYPET